MKAKITKSAALILVEKRCNNCGRIWDQVPERARKSDDENLSGFYWECQCQSTMFIPLSKIVEYGEVA